MCTYLHSCTMQQSIIYVHGVISTVTVSQWYFLNVWGRGICYFPHASWYSKNFVKNAYTVPVGICFKCHALRVFIPIFVIEIKDDL